MKHRAFTLVEMLIVVILLAGLAALLVPLFTRTRESGHRSPHSICMSNLKQLGLGMLQYVQDNDETYPPLAVAASGYWAGSLQPYIKSWQIFQCPSDPTGRAPKTTDYFYNARVAGARATAKFAAPSDIILMGDGTGDHLTSYHLRQLPASWVSDSNSPAYRHRDKANYLFANGRVKALAAGEITLSKPGAGEPTFLVR